MIKYIEGDLFANISDSRTTLIAHVCNDKGAWGSGFVVPLEQHFPDSAACYRAWSKGELTDAHRDRIFNTKASNNPPFSLGQTQFVRLGENLAVANMVAQTLGGERPLFYNHLSMCMDRVAHFMLGEQYYEVICPMFGSGLAGGDWNFVEKLIEDCWIKRGIAVTVCYLPQFLPDNWSPPDVTEAPDTTNP